MKQARNQQTRSLSVHLRWQPRSIMVALLRWSRSQINAPALLQEATDLRDASSTSIKRIVNVSMHEPTDASTLLTIDILTTMLDGCLHTAPDHRRSSARHRSDYFELLLWKPACSSKDQIDENHKSFTTQASMAMNHANKKACLGPPSL